MIIFNKIFAMILATSFIFFSGCATTDDPRSGGFFGGIGGLTSGKYEERIEARQGTLGALKAARADLETEQNELERQKLQSLARLQIEKRRLAILEEDTKKLSLKIDKLRVEDTKKRAEIGELQKRMAQLENNIKQVDKDLGADVLEGNGEDSTTNDARVRELEAQRNQLEEELRLLTDMYLKLGS